MEQLTHRRHRIELLDGAMTMHGLIAQTIEENRLGEDRDASRGFEVGSWMSALRLS
jgi:hypothetical protein